MGESRVASFASLVLACWALSPAPAEAQTYTVGGPRGDFATIAAAVSAVPAGSTVLVAPGTYGDDCTFPVLTISEPLTLAAPGAGSVTYHGRVVVEGLAAGETVTLAGFTIQSAEADPCLEIRDVSGGLAWVEDCVLRGSFHCLAFSGAGPLEVTNAHDVVIVRSYVDVQDMFSATPAMVATDSTTHLFQSTLSGRFGYEVMVVDDGFLFAAGTELVSRGDAPMLRLTGTSPEVVLIDATFTYVGGPFVPPPPNSLVEAGTLTEIPFPEHRFDVESPVSPRRPATLTFTAPPGEFVWYEFASEPAASFRPLNFGTKVLDPNAFSVVPVGTVGPGGTIEASIAAFAPPTPALAGFPGTVLRLQSLFLDPVAGTLLLSTPATLVVEPGSAHVRRAEGLQAR